MVDIQSATAEIRRGKNKDRCHWMATVPNGVEKLRKISTG